MPKKKSASKPVAAIVTAPASKPVAAIVTAPASKPVVAIVTAPVELQETLRPLDKDFVAEQTALGAQSCRGITSPDLSPLRGNDHAMKVFKQMLAKEKAMAGEWTCFYHSYNSPALIYEVQAAVAKVLFKFRAKYGVLPRLLKKPFEKLPDAAAMLKAFPTWPDQDHNPAFKSVGICCSTSLVSADPEATPVSVFLRGYGASAVGIEVMEKLLVDCGTPKKHVRRLAQSVMSLADSNGLTGCTSGHLLQIFIHRSCVDKWAYASFPMGVPDSSRHPLSKSMARNGVIVGQARLTVNPSAFMRASAVRLHVYSANATYHARRHSFQDALFDVLAPILGSTENREAAAKGIYGGQLPSWWRDLESEKGNEHCADGADAEDKTACRRTRCRYGAACRREALEHRKDFAHPGDADWEDLVEVKSGEAEESQDKCGACEQRPRCRYGSDCYRKSADHLSKFSHPSDADWERSLATESNAAALGNEASASCTTSPKWLSSLLPKHLEDFKSDLDFMRTKFGLSAAELRSNADHLEIQLTADTLAALESAKVELAGLLDHYKAQVSTSTDISHEIVSLHKPLSVEVKIAGTCTEREEERVDPEDGKSWTWAAYRKRYEGEFSWNELCEYWDTMLPIAESNTNEVAKVASRPCRW